MAAPTIPYTIPGTVDQEKPEIVARISFSGATAAEQALSHTWVDVSDRLRSFQIDRGGENELELIDTGTCTVVLDNRDRELDPFNTASSYSPNVLPRRRLWIESQWDGDTISQFYGWTGAWQPGWTATTDAVVTVNAQDGFAIASGDSLPTTSPPRDSYAELVEFDKPLAWWPLDDPSGSLVAADRAESGMDFNGRTTGTPPDFQTDDIIVGTNDGAAEFSLGGAGTVTDLLRREEFTPLVGFTALTVEAWVTPATIGGGFIAVLTPTGTSPFGFTILSSGLVEFRVRDSTVSEITTTGATVLQAGVKYHLVGTYAAGDAVRIYVNGVQDAVNTSEPAVIVEQAGTTSLYMHWHQAGTPTNAATYQHAAIYPYALSAARVSAHYEAGTNMGHEQDTTDSHVAVALEESGIGFLPRRLRTGAREILPVYFHGQPPKEWFEDAVRTEGDPSMFYFAKDGAAVFLDRDHRSASPWSTVQATFDDDGTDLPYLDGSLQIDDGEAFLYNDVRVTASGGELQQNFDTASISAYQRRVLDRGETLNVDDTDADDESTTLLAKYKDPLPRITSMSLNGGQDINHPGVLNQILEREIGDKVRVITRPVGGGSAINQEAYIRKISLSGSPGDPYCTVTWALREGEAGTTEIGTGSYGEGDYGDDDYGE